MKCVSGVNLLGNSYNITDGWRIKSNIFKAKIS